MAENKKISQLPVATLPITTGVKFEALQGGINVQVDADDMPGSSGGTSIPYGVTSGTNTYTIAASPAVTAYTDGMLLHIRVGTSSTSLVTLNFDSVGAKKLFDTAGTQAQDGYLKAGVDYLVVYNAALDTAAGGFTVVNELVHGVMNLRGTFVSAGGGVWPTGAGSGPSGGIRHGDVFVMGDADTLGAKVVNAGDFITTTVDNPGQTDSNWYVIPGPQAPRRTRTEDGATAPASVQGDDNSIIVLNSATPFNFTLDQLTASSKISFWNIGAGAVTLVAGTGVTITGSVVIPGAVGTEYPSAFAFYHTATTPRVSIGGAESGRVAVAISTGTLTLDINNEIRRDFDLTATESSNFTIAFSNTTNWKESSLTLRLTGTIAITMPSTVRMENFENTSGRWNTSTRVLTLTGITASPFEILFAPQGSIIECQASDRFV